MSLQSWNQCLITAQVDGPTLTAAAAATCLPATAKYTFPAAYFLIGRKLRIRAQGRISCVVTTPGTARFDVRLGGTVVWDSGALNLNTTAKTNVPWSLDVELICRSIGSSTSSTLFGMGKFTSEAVVGAAANTAGGNASLLCPVTAPAVGGGFDSTVQQQLDMYFTQTVATGSMTLHMFSLESMN